MNQPVAFAFLLTLLAGLSTGVGGLIAFFTKHANKTMLSLGLGFSAGVMIYISFVEMLASARTSLIPFYGERPAAWIAVGGFFAGIVGIGLIDRLIPSYENPHEARNIEQPQAPRTDPGLLRLGVVTALAIAVHNFPEGLATLVSALTAPTRGVSVAIAIAIHNIPEGIAVAVPIYYATGSQQKAFTYSLISGVAEPIGAIAGYGLMKLFLPATAMGVANAVVAGIMVFISLDQLIPNAHQYCKGHVPIYGMVAGMAVMALTLLVLA